MWHRKPCIIKWVNVKDLNEKMIGPEYKVGAQYVIVMRWRMIKERKFLFCITSTSKYLIFETQAVADAL